MPADMFPAFGVLLSRYRLTAGLTQEGLAERAALSARAISDLERGVRAHPYPLTVQRLADALRLDPSERALFEEAARRPNPASGDGSPAVSELSVGSFLGAAPSGALVARDEEVGRIQTILDSVGVGTGHLLLLAGELGVGKTRLAQEVMGAALRRGYVVGTGRCYQGEQATAYEPVREAMDELAAGAAPTVRAEVHRRRQEVRVLLRDGPAAPDGSSESPEQRQLFAAVAALLAALAEGVPVAVLLDDLHWADAGTVKLLHYLARATHGLRVLLLGTFRDMHLSEEHPVLAQTVQDLARERLQERISVRRLVPEETTALVASLMGQHGVSEEFAGFVHRRTKGVPRLIHQLVRSLGGRLELQGEIGAGAMGRVFRAFDHTTGTTVAAKLVLARDEIALDALLRFQQEGAVLAALHHPHIVTVHDTFVEEHASCIIMELLDGPSLGQILCETCLPLPRAKRLALQIADALAYAHRQGIVHRDIKPDNVMVVADDQVKVTDFGIARILQPDTSLQTIATTGMRLGTPLYMAPEQIADKKIDGRTDVYAFGALLFHMVIGQPPFEGGDALAVAVKHLQEDPPRPSALNPAVPAEWDALILRALAKDPARRFQSATELEQAVAALGEGTGTPAGRSRRPPARAWGPAGRWTTPRWIATAAGLLVLVVAAIAGRAYTSTTPQHPTPATRHTALGARLDAYFTALTAQHRFSGTVFVARRGLILLSKGYGLADRAAKRPNTTGTRYAVSGVQGSLSFLGALRLEDHGQLADNAPICRYLTGCPPSWRPITVHRVLAGTSGLPGFDTSTLAGRTTAQSLRLVQGLPLGPAKVDYMTYDGAPLVLSLLTERVSGEPWGTFLQRTIFGPAGMTHSGRLTPATAPPTLARTYDGATRDSTSVGTTSSFFSVYATAPDVYAYDNALFGGRLVSQAVLSRLFTPRGLAPVPTVGFDQAHYGNFWSSGQVAGHRVIYTVTGTTANLRFPQDGVTIVVMSNDAQNIVGDIAVHAAELLFGQTRAARVVAPGLAVVATFTGHGTVGNFPIALTPGAIWFPTFSPKGYMGTITRLDSRTGRVVATINVSDPGIAQPEQGAGAVAVVNGQVWAADSGSRTVKRIDPATNKVVASIPVGVPVGAVAGSGDTLWATADNALGDGIARVDLRTLKVVAVIKDAGHPFIETAATSDALWYISTDTETLVRVDAATNKVGATITAGPVPQAVVVGYGAVWVGDASGNLVTRIDPRTNKVVASITTAGYPGNRQPSIMDCNCRYAAGDGSVWVIGNSTTLVRIDPRTNRNVASLTFPQRIGSIGLSEGSIWAATDWAGTNQSYTIYRVNPGVTQ